MKISTHYQVIPCVCVDMDVELSGSVVNGRYGVEKKIQSGYFGTTWLAVDKLNNTQVCLKVSL